MAGAARSDWVGNDHEGGIKAKANKSYRLQGAVQGVPFGRLIASDMTYALRLFNHIFRRIF